MIDEREIDDGGPAFPVGLAADPSGDVYGGNDGMSLRDYFATKALDAYVLLIGTPNDEPDELWDESIAKRAYAMADAMLKARKEGK